MAVQNHLAIVSDMDIVTALFRLYGDRGNKRHVVTDARKVEDAQTCNKHHDHESTIKLSLVDGVSP